MVLEPQLEIHADEMFGVLSDPAIYEFENEPPKSVDWLRNRYVFLEGRSSRDGREQWLNWVIRLPEGNLIGYVQATVFPDGTASIGYELASAHWGKGLARQAVEGMIRELAQTYRVSAITATFKSKNFRSRRLLERLGFEPATVIETAQAELEEDEEIMMLSKLRP